MSDVVNIIRVGSENENLHRIAPAGSLLYNESTGEYFKVVKPTVAGDTIASLRQYDIAIRLDRWLGEFATFGALQQAITSATPGSYAWIRNPLIPNAPLRIAAWDEDSSEWVQTGDTGSVNAAPWTAATGYQQGQIVRDGAALYIVQQDYTSRPGLTDDLTANDLLPISSPIKVEEWQTGSSYTPGTLIYDAAQTGLYASLRLFTASATIADDVANGDIIKAISIPTAHSAATYGTTFDMVTGSTNLLAGQTSIVDNAASPDEGGIYLALVDNPADLKDFVKVASGGDGKAIKLAVDEAERLAFIFPSQIEIGSLILQQDDKNIYRFVGPGTAGQPTNPTEWEIIYPALPTLPATGTAIRQQLTFNPEKAFGQFIEWEDARPEMGMVDTLADLSDRALLPQSFLVLGKLVYVRLEMKLYELTTASDLLANTIDDWTPLVSGIEFKGRQGDLPKIAEHGQMFVVRMDFGGKDIYRLVVWDDSITVNRLARVDTTQLSIVTGTNIPTTPPDAINIDFKFPRNSVLGQPADIQLALDYQIAATPNAAGVATVNKLFTVAAVPGNTGHTIAVEMATEINKEMVGGEVIAKAVGTVLTLTPREASVPLVPTTNLGVFNSAADRPTTPTPGEWATVGTTFGNYDAGGTLMWVGGATGWDYTPPLNAGGLGVIINPLGPNDGAQWAFADLTDLTLFGPGSGTLNVGQFIKIIGPSTPFGTTFTFPAADPVSLPGMGDLAGKTLTVNDFAIYEGAGAYRTLTTTDPDYIAIVNAHATGKTLHSIGGTPVPAPTPPANWMPATAGSVPVHITSAFAIPTPTGPLEPVRGGGWRWLNREIWNKELRASADQDTDTAEGDLQITREDQHEEIKSWNEATAQWDTIYSRDEINAAIAALSLFEGTAMEVGGAAIGAVTLDNLPNLPAMTTAGDLSQVSHYWTFIGTSNYVIDATTPNVGADLAGAVINPGDWLQIANRGTVAAPQLHWVTIGGDLLAKARADRLFGFQPWTAGGWEQGALVVHSGEVYRASQPVTTTDGAPGDGGLVPIDTDTGFITNNLIGGVTALLPVGGVPGDADRAIAGGTIPAGTSPFAGKTYVRNDTFVFVAAPELAGKGLTVEGFEFDQGWVFLGQTPLPPTLTVTPPPGNANSIWQKVNISGGLKVAANDGDLPQKAVAGQVWIVLSSAKANGQQALYSFDGGAGQWQELGGGAGVPLDLNGGIVVYPKAYFQAVDGAVSLTPGANGTPQPRIIGDVLFRQNAAGFPHLNAISKDGTTWSYIHPARYTTDGTGAGRPAKADYPMQLNVNMTNNKAKITHIGDRALQWIPMEEPPKVILESQPPRYTRANGRSEWYPIPNKGVLRIEAMGYNPTVHDGTPFIGFRLPGVPNGRYATKSSMRMHGYGVGSYGKGLNNDYAIVNGESFLNIWWDNTWKVKQDTIFTMSVMVVRMGGTSLAWEVIINGIRNSGSQQMEWRASGYQPRGDQADAINFGIIANDAEIYTLTTFSPRSHN